MNRIDRISAILIQLQSRRVVRAQDIAARFQISLRTVYRDIRSLEQAGIPLIGEAGLGYSLVDGFRLPPVMFTHEEAIAFLTAEKLVAQLTDGPNAANYRSAMYKIRAVLNPAEKDLLENIGDHIEVFRRPGDTALQPDLNLIQPVLNSIDQHKVLTIKYFAQYNQQKTERSIEPLGVFFAENYWHLIAWCQMRNDYRDFRLDRISAMQLTEIPFAGKHPKLKEYLDKKSQVNNSEHSNLQLVVIRIEKAFARWLDHQKYYSGFISEKELDGEVEMVFLSSSLDGFARWYMIFGDHASILEPEILKEKVRCRLAAISLKV